jgi:hypothetical protein
MVCRACGKTAAEGECKSATSANRGISKYGLLFVVLWLLPIAGAHALQQSQSSTAQVPSRLQKTAQSPAHPHPYKGRDTWYEFLLTQFNPDNLDYGAWIEQRRQSFLAARVRNPYFGFTLFATLALCLMASVVAKMRMDQRRVLWITAEWMADVYNHDVYSRESARKAIQRYNEHIERCNRAIEAGESGHSGLNAVNQETEALRAELQRVGTELAGAKRENEVLQEQLRGKATLVTEMSLRLDALQKRTGSDCGRVNGVPVQGANPDLVKHINGLQEQLYAERQKNRQLKGA